MALDGMPTIQRSLQAIIYYFYVQGKFITLIYCHVMLAMYMSFLTIGMMLMLVG